MQALSNEPLTLLQGWERVKNNFILGVSNTMGTARSSPDRMERERESKRESACVLLGWQGATVAAIFTTGAVNRIRVSPPPFPFIFPFLAHGKFVKRFLFSISLFF